MRDRQTHMRDSASWAYAEITVTVPSGVPCPIVTGGYFGDTQRFVHIRPTDSTSVRDLNFDGCENKVYT